MCYRDESSGEGSGLGGGGGYKTPPPCFNTDVARFREINARYVIINARDYRVYHYQCQGLQGVPLSIPGITMCTIINTKDNRSTIINTMDNRLLFYQCQVLQNVPLSVPGIAGCCIINTRDNRVYHYQYHG